MANINLRYGRSSIGFEFNKDQFKVLGESSESEALNDVQIGERIDTPVESPTLDEIINPGESVLIVVPDATRRTGCGQIINLLVRRLIANGTMPFDIRIIFATGIHRKVTEQEKAEIVTPFIAQRVKMLDHNPRDLAQIVRLGITKSGIPVELNRALTEHDHTIIIGGIGFHYFAGFTGGRKLICPGLGSTRTVSETHKLAFDFETKARRQGVELGKLQGNAVHEAFIEVVEQCPPSFAVSTIVGGNGEIVEVFAGDWKSSHLQACRFYSEKYTIKIREKRETVIVSCGGYPHDINLIQAHKALDAASEGCSEGGTIILLAECENGFGRADFPDWFAAENSDELAGKLCENYQVNGQTAWSFLKIAERFKIKMISSLKNEDARRMRIHPVRDLKSAMLETDPKKSGYIVPFGAKFQIK